MLTEAQLERDGRIARYSFYAMVVLALIALAKVVL
jgi:hypothetical protein